MHLHSPYILSLLTIASAYNLDPRNPTVFKDPKPGPSSRGTYFGYSVALFSSSSSDANNSDWAALVGAPRANSSSLSAIEPGSVYACHSDGRCAEWLVDDSNDGRLNGRWITYDQRRDYAWLGANIKVENSTRPKIAVCAPRWKSFAQPMEYMNGMCFSGRINRTADFERVRAKRYFPLVREDKQTMEVGKDVLYLNGMGQSGFSLDLTEGSLLIGAPGVFHWSGTAMLLDERSERNSYDALSPDPVDSRFEYNDYFGYSVISGKFFADNSKRRLYVASAPRSSDMLGKVYVFTFPAQSGSKLIVKSTIAGEHVGEYFGYSLTSCDTNRDGRDELIVGAPFWSRESDEGRVYVYAFRNQQDYSTERIEGEAEAGRFGSAISCLGDIDRDGYADVAVGAPYDGDGAVYIFNGGPAGLDKVYTQVIRASDFPRYSLRGFGISISNPRDVDGDGYLDVAVGAYSSGHAVLFRARPVVTTNVKIYGTENLTLTENSTYFLVDVCMNYSGAFVASTLDVNLTLPTDEPLKRIVIYEGRLYNNTYQGSFTLKKDRTTCKTIRIRIKRNIPNVLDPIPIAANMTILNDSCSTNCPMINPRASSSDFVQVEFALDCGDDDVCDSDLNLGLTSSLNRGNRYVVGSKANVNLTIFVENKGEPAYGTLAHIYMLKPIGLSRIPPECDEKSSHNDTSQVVCSVGNPLRYNNSLTLELDMSGVDSTKDSTEIQVEITTKSQLKDASNLTQILNIDYDFDADVKVLGKSYEETYINYDRNKSGSSVENITFDHIYETWKSGVSPVEEIVFLVNVPTHWQNVEIAKIVQMSSFTSGKQYPCDTIYSEEVSIEEEFANKRNSSTLIPLDNGSLFIKCSDPEVVCQRFQCRLSPFRSVQSVAKVNVTVSLNLSNFTSSEIKEKNILFFVTDSLALITQPNVTIASIKNSYNFKEVATVVVGLSKAQEVSLWIIIVSVLLGLFMLMMIVLLLYKMGFFRRKLREDMDALKPKENTDHDNVSVD